MPKLGKQLIFRDNKAMTNKGLINQIPQAVSQAVQPLVEQAANDISSTLGSGNSSSSVLYQQPSGTSLPSPSNINNTPIQSSPSNNRPMLNNTSGGMIFDQYRQPGNMGRFISPSEMKATDPSYAYAPPTQLFAEGGMATQAQNLASRGRGEDKMLVHMTPSEVEGLQALAMSKGGSLTINPETGLPEAGFLSDTFKALAPTLIGAGIMMIPGVGAAAAPYIGAGIGALEYARTGDLGKGLSAGLGAYGGAGMAGGFMSAGAGAGAGTTANTQALGQYGFGSEAAKAATTAAPETFAGNLANAGKGVTNLVQPGGTTDFLTAMGGPKQALIQGAASAGSIAGGLGAFDYKPMKLAEETDDNYEGPYLPTERTATFRGRDAILNGEGREFRYFNPINPYPAVRTATAAHGGLMSAKKMAEGGRYLDGPGDGVSDSIPATVDGEQPVLLSEGEYIIPAEVVSAVGNGSSDAGADKFTALVDTIMAKTRRVTKGKPNGADKLLKGLVPQTA